MKTSQNKYRNRIVWVDNIRFHSKKEADYYLYLKFQKQNGEIKDFELQPEFILQEKFAKDGKKYQAIKYKADFKVYFNDGTFRIIDVKPFDKKTGKYRYTKEFKIKAKLFDFRYPDLTLEIV